MGMRQASLGASVAAPAAKAGRAELVSMIRGADREAAGYIAEITGKNMGRPARIRLFEPRRILELDDTLGYYCFMLGPNTIRISSAIPESKVVSTTAHERWHLEDNFGNGRRMPRSLKPMQSSYHVIVGEAGADLFELAFMTRGHKVGATEQIVNGLLKNVSRIEALYDALDCTQNGFNPLERIKGAISLVAHIELRKKGIVKPNTWKPADNLYYMAESAKRRCAFSSEFAGLFLAMNGFDAAGTLNYLLSRKPMEALEEIGRMMSLDREREAVRELYSLVRK